MQPLCNTDLGLANPVRKLTKSNPHDREGGGTVFTTSGTVASTGRSVRIA